MFARSEYLARAAGGRMQHWRRIPVAGPPTLAARVAAGACLLLGVAMLVVWFTVRRLDSLGVLASIPVPYVLLALLAWWDGNSAWRIGAVASIAFFLVNLDVALLLWLPPLDRGASAAQGELLLRAGVALAVALLFLATWFFATRHEREPGSPPA
jgi:hypothetical protein